MEQEWLTKLKSPFFGALLCAASFVSSWAHAFDCKVDPTYLQTAKATGGGVLCRPKGTFDPNEPLGFFEMRRSTVQVLAFWKVLGHGSMDSYLYDGELPADHVKLELLDFPSGDFVIKSVYAEASDGRKGRPARLISTEAIGSAKGTSRPGAKKKVSRYVFDLPTELKEFKLVIEGVTSRGTPFIQFSQETYRSGTKSDRALGLEMWSKIFKELGGSLSSAVKEKYLKDAFGER